MAKKNKKMAILLIEVSLVGFFAIGMYSYMQKELKPVEVFVYKNKMMKNAEVEESDIGTKLIPEKAKGSGFLTAETVDKIKAGGMVMASDVDPGQYVYDLQIVEGDKVDPFETIELDSYRKISIPVSYETSMAGEIKRGDKVDLVFNGKYERADGSEGNYAKTFLQDVLVYSVTTGEGFAYVGHSHLKKSDSIVPADGNSDETIPAEDLTAPALVTIAVPIHQAEEILARLETGTVKILGRFEESTQTDTSGHVIVPQGEKIYSGQMDIEVGN